MPAPMTTSNTLRMGLVGGGTGAFIGAVHRMAMRLDGQAQLVAGCLSSTPEKAIASGREIWLDPSRNYTTWKAMLEGELALPRDRRIDGVSIVTPNALHYDIAAAFATAGINVICDKPMVTTSAHARQLIELVRTSNLIFAVTYNYSGYPMVKQARAMVRGGELGAIRKVVVEYHQGWLASALENTGHKQAAWRADPNLAGPGGAIADIGSHAEHLMSYVTGLEIESFCADASSIVPGRRMDDDVSVLLRFSPRDGVAARGVMMVSQIEVGSENDLRLGVIGEKASLHWRQEQPNELVVRRDGAHEQVMRRGSHELDQSSHSATRLPPGHPEGFIEAFANIYRNIFAAIRAGKGGLESGRQFDFPDVRDGARGVQFMERVIASAGSESKWFSMDGAP